ncbi:MAG: four helix bundle protein [Planctomycetaceae bacterium]
MTKAGDIEDRLIDFAVRVLNVTEALPNTKAGNHIAGQLVRSGMIAAPNYGEARAAESRRDFVHKMKVCLKELRETLICCASSNAKSCVHPNDWRTSSKNATSSQRSS